MFFYESRPAFLPLITRGRHLPSSWTNFPFIPHTCHSSHIPSCPSSPQTIYTPHSRPSVWLDYPHSSTHLCYVYVSLCCVTDYVRSSRSGHLHCVAVCGVPFLNIVLFLPVGLWFLKEKKLTCTWTQISVFFGAPCSHRDRI